MTTKKSYDVAKKLIEEYFQSRSQKIFTFNEIGAILTEHKQSWKLPAKSRIHDFIGFLTDKLQLKEFYFGFPGISISRYVWGDLPILSVVLTLKPGSYFTHYTAMYIHELTEQVPKSIYLNFEQQKKHKNEIILEQDNIRKAFNNSPRISNTVAECNGYSIYLLNGQYTGKLGVMEYKDSDNNKLYITDVERTLIDIVVRPNYSGGVFEVLKAYERAAGKVSINKLAAMLSELDYVYPYHQAVGFYLERAGVYKGPQINLLDQFEKKYDFYLTHQMKNPAYSKRWKIYYPKNF
jgi:predicted transcriptional regulator of viral defense system